MKINRFLLSLLLALVILPTSAKADYVFESHRSCSYSSTEDCIGFSIITETCTIYYTNGTTATTTRTYADPTMCFWCFILAEPCTGID